MESYNNHVCCSGIEFLLTLLSSLFRVRSGRTNLAEIHRFNTLRTQGRANRRRGRGLSRSYDELDDEVCCRCLLRHDRCFS